MYKQRHLSPIGLFSFAIRHTHYTRSKAKWIKKWLVSPHPSLHLQHTHQITISKFSVAALRLGSDLVFLKGQESAIDLKFLDHTLISLLLQYHFILFFYWMNSVFTLIPTSFKQIAPLVISLFRGDKLSPYLHFSTSAFQHYSGKDAGHSSEAAHRPMGAHLLHCFWTQLCRVLGSIKPLVRFGAKEVHVYLFHIFNTT